MKNKGSSVMKIKKSVLSISLIILAVFFTIIIKTVDVKAIGPNNSFVGLSSINHFFSQNIKYNQVWYQISEILGIMAILLALVFAFVGLYEWIKRKSLKKVDPELFLLGAFYVVVLIIYLLFEKLAINYRPILIDDMLEASYPSSHTMLSLCICGSAVFISKYFIKNQKKREIFKKCTVLLMILLVVTRFLSGVHWVTDIIGGIIISAALLSTFNWQLENLERRKNASQKDKI